MGTIDADSILAVVKYVERPLYTFSYMLCTLGMGKIVDWLAERGYEITLAHVLNHQDPDLVNRYLSLETRRERGICICYVAAEDGNKPMFDAYKQYHNTGMGTIDGYHELLIIGAVLGGNIEIMNEVLTMYDDINSVFQKYHGELWQSTQKHRTIDIMEILYGISMTSLHPDRLERALQFTLLHAKHSVVREWIMQKLGRRVSYDKWKDHIPANKYRVLLPYVQLSDNNAVSMMLNIREFSNAEQLTIVTQLVDMLGRKLSNKLIAHAKEFEVIKFLYYHANCAITAIDIKRHICDMSGCTSCDSPAHMFWCVQSGAALFSEDTKYIKWLKERSKLFLASCVNMKMLEHFR